MIDIDKIPILITLGCKKSLILEAAELEAYSLVNRVVQEDINMFLVCTEISVQLYYTGINSQLAIIAL